MTPNAAVYSTLSKVCPGRYVAFVPGKVPPLPWFVYKRVNGGEVFADNSNYSLMHRYRVELFFEENDPELIASFEAALGELGTYRLYDANWMDSEGCLMHDYRLAYHPHNDLEGDDTNNG